MLNENDSQVACENALEEIKYQISDLPESKIKDKIIRKIGELDILIAMALEAQSDKGY